MHHRIVWLALLLALASGALAGQPAPAGTADRPPPQETPEPQPPVTFRVEVNYVEVDAIVTDAQGRFVSDLGPDDFEILEEGTPQSVAQFSLVNLPVAAPVRPLFANEPIEFDVRSNVEPFDGRFFMIVLDDLHTSPLRTTLVRSAASRFVTDHMGANDLAAVAYTSGRNDVSQEFTSSQRLLLAAIQEFAGRKLESSTLAREEAFTSTLGEPRGGRGGSLDPLENERAHQARLTLDTVEGLVDLMSGVHGRRKALLLFSEGIDYNVFDAVTSPQSSVVLAETRETIGAATRANVAIYAIDPRGLSALGDDLMDLQAPVNRRGLSSDDGTPLPDVVLGPETLIDELRLAQGSLRTLADQTGGLAVVDTNDYATAFDRIIRDTSAYYILGYYPTDDRRDGRFREIEVRVKRPGLQVRARRGYIAPRGDAEISRVEAGDGSSPEIRDLLTSPVGASGLGLSLSAAPFRGEDDEASVALTVEIDGPSLPFTERDGAFAAELEVAAVAYDSTGEIRPGDRQTADLDLRPETHALISREGLRLSSRMSLPPGRYQLRVAAREVLSGRGGAVLYDLAIPRFTEQPLAISGLAVSSGAASRMPWAHEDPELRRLLAGPPTASRRFTAGDRLTVFAEIYDNAGRGGHVVDIATTVRASDGREVFRTMETRSSDELPGGRGGYGHVAEIPLAGLPPGLYALGVEGISRLPDVPGVRRETLFWIEAPAGSPATSSLSPTSLVEGVQSGVDAFHAVVVKTPEQWTRIREGLSLPADLPEVDFARDMIVGVFLGARPTAGYRARVVGASRVEDALVVQYAEGAPDPGVVVSQVVTTPFHLVLVPQHDGEVRFEQVGE